MYRAGGPTTIFGGAGFGPFSEGPLNAPKKAFYTREGITEENWMFEAAQRTLSASEDFARGRREALLACGGVLGATAKAEKKEGDDSETDAAKKRKRGEELPLGVYEPHSGVVLCELCSFFLGLFLG
jgi:chromatin structure-remodeling complex protein RSC7